MQNNKAFTLIELLITLAIIAIIIAIAYPNYTTHLIKTRRAQAKDPAVTTHPRGRSASREPSRRL